MNEHQGHTATSEHHADHDQHEHHGEHDHSGHVEMYRRLFWIMLVIAIPVVGLNAMFADLVGYGLPDAGWVPWVSPVLGTLMYVWGGRVFLTGGIDEIRAKSPGMMLLIALAIPVAFVASWGSTLGLLPHGLDFWWELALLVVIMLLGHWIEMRSLARTTSALDSQVGS